jgi:hypothetical protein
MRSVRQLLASQADLRKSLSQWKPRSAMAVSRDGSAIVGQGINPSGHREGWLAELAHQPATVAPLTTIARR